MKESFNPSDEEYKKVEDLPEEHQGEFADVPEEMGGGFVKKEAMENTEQTREKIGSGQDVENLQRQALYEKEKREKGDQDRIREIRGDLGLEEVDEKVKKVQLSDSMVRELKKTEESFKEKERERREEEAEQHKQSAFKKELEYVGNSISRLGRFFNMREERRLTTLLSNEDISQISHGARALSESIKSSGKTDYDSIKQAFYAIRGALDNYDTRKSHDSTREDSDSLVGLAGTVRESMRSVQDLMSILHTMDNKEAEQTRRTAVGLIVVLEDILRKIRRRIDLVLQYQRRR